MAATILPHDPVVITGIGLITSVGHTREAVWRAVQRGQSGVRSLRGMLGIPDDLLIGASVDFEADMPGRLKAITLGMCAAEEALQDARINWNTIDRERFACAVSAVPGDWSFRAQPDCYNWQGPEGTVPWWQQFLPNSTAAHIGERFGLYGPRLAHSTACASGLIGVLAAARAIQDGQCEIALAGAGDAIDPLFAAGFRQMRVLAEHDDPTQACRPFDRNRNGFVLGEGAAMFVLERLSHAINRGARIYAQYNCGNILAEAHHVTGLDVDSETLVRLIQTTLERSGLEPEDIGHINTHGTGTEQNDRVEMRAIAKTFGPAVRGLTVTANKSLIGHLINAAGSAELALTLLAMRDGFAPPTLNLTDPDPECQIDCTPLVGRVKRFQHALKISVAFGGHLVAVSLSRWNDAATGFAYPERRAAA